MHDAARSNARTQGSQDPATINVTKGWCRVMGLVAPSVFLAVALGVRNLALVDAFGARALESQRRRAAGLEPTTRRRRRTSLTELALASP